MSKVVVVENKEVLYQNFNSKSLLDLRSNFYTYIFAYFKKRVIISYPELIKPSIYTISN